MRYVCNQLLKSPKRYIVRKEYLIGIKHLDIEDFLRISKEAHVIDMLSANHWKLSFVTTYF